ncbi:tol-pal system protein YbgF [Desulfobotulus sp. H1]|uniref:Tol-pal system protein YbgF n=1 Tax=Desulfobotulus pelophilus TaxID=2823377 RepID=A0ABT3N643_9BACT|nr:tol-pal system protein YbgF [Desulfobotulus pelophilus]MCW7752936.1 tol-pal system protein YbgF [Desulfobotulus pelophilus]
MCAQPGSISIRSLSALLLTAGLLCACATHQTDSEMVRIATMEKQIARNEEMLSDLSQRLSVMQFMVDGHERMLRSTPSLSPVFPADAGKKDREAASSQPTPVPSPGQTQLEPNALYEKAFSTMQQREFEKAAHLFRQLADSFPDHSLADNALYWLGECHYARRDYRQAIDVFEEVPKQYPKGGKVPDALLKNAYSRIHIGDKENARDILRQLIRDYPFTDAASKAEARLKTLF